MKGKGILIFKKIYALLMVGVVSGVYAETLNVDWMNEDGSVYQSTTCEVGGDVILPSTIPTKEGYIFAGWEPAVKRIEYIQSTGTQCIDTGYVYGSNTTARVIIDTVFFVSSGSKNIHGLSQDEFGGPFVGMNGNCFFSTGWGPSNKCGKLGVRYLFDLNIPNRGFNVKEVSSNLIVTNEWNISVSYVDVQRPSFFLFCPPGADKNVSKVYSAKLYDGGLLVRDMVPVLDANNVPCMYDYVTGQFFYNSGTGDFIAGPVVGDL